MRVFITGATGFVGEHILAALLAAGHQPLALVRPGSEQKFKSLEKITLIHGDATEPGGWVDRMGEAEAVINLVAIIREFPSRGVTFEKLNFEASRNVIDAAVKAGSINRFLQMSANGASADGVSAYQTTKWRAEEYLKQSGLSHTIFRPSVIFGDSGGKMEFCRELASVIRLAPLMPLFGGGHYQLDPVAVEDVASCFVAALGNDQAAGRTFHLGGGEPRSFADIVQIIGKAVGKKRTATFPLPFPVIEPMARLMGRFAFFPVTFDQLAMLKLGNVCPELLYRQFFSITPKPFTYQNLGYLSDLKR